MDIMDMKPLGVLAIDEDQPTLAILSNALSLDKRISVFSTVSPDEALKQIILQQPKIVLLGSIPGPRNAMDFLQEIVEEDPGIDVILLANEYSTEFALDVIQRGACDCLAKPVIVEQVCDRVQSLVSAALTRRRTFQLDQQLAKEFRFEGMVGRSPLMLDLYANIARVARHFRTALISGATGTGKELVAKALHACSPVRDHPFVAFNCAAVVDTLVESELFGHVKGAFTGAVQDRVGVFEYANGGVLFLDEIGDMAPAAQAKLLRVIQNLEVQRVGSPVIKKIDVRIVAATNRDLHGLMEKKRFREDLYYRLAVAQVRLPTLAERKEDLPILQREFVERFTAQTGKNIRGITRRAQAVLTRYSWPGNVRELESALSHACMMADADFVDVGDLPQHVREPVKPIASNGLYTLEEMNRRYVRKIISRLGGNKVKAAEALGISRATLYRILSSRTMPTSAEPVESSLLAG
jgi:DNA-binding NtrC family response regulator